MVVTLLWRSPSPPSDYKRTSTSYKQWIHITPPSLPPSSFTPPLRQSSTTFNLSHQPPSPLPPTTLSHPPLPPLHFLTLHSSPSTPHSPLLTLHSSSSTPHPPLLTLHSSPSTPHPPLLTLHSSPERYGDQASFFYLPLAPHTFHLPHFGVPVGKCVHNMEDGPLLKTQLTAN